MFLNTFFFFSINFLSVLRKVFFIFSYHICNTDLAILLYYFVKFGYIYTQLTILSYCSSIQVPDGDWNESWFVQSMSSLQIFMLAEGAKNVSWP